MLLNKVLFVSLLVLGLCFLQPALGKERLAKRIAGGTVATAGQFPFVVLIQYPFTDSTGNTFTYQGTGVIYNNNLVLTTANAVAKCNNVQMTITQGSVTTFSPGASAQQLVFTCVKGTNIILPASFVPGVYTNDIAQIILPLSFTGQVSLRVPTSSPTAADIGKLFAVGWGESVPGAQPSPQLLYVPLNPQRNHVCYNRALSLGITGNFSFSENFCVAGFVQSPATGVVTDACVFDAGAPIIRTSNINSPYADHELIGLVNFGSCSASSPVIATYLFKYLPTLPAQTAAPPAGSPANPRSFDGNFACGDGIVQDGGYEKCDPPTTVIADRENPTFCCNPWTCQYEVAGTACTVDNRNGTKCQSQPRCNNRGNCVVKFKKGVKCNGPKTKCHLGKCCTYPGATNCV